MKDSIETLQMVKEYMSSLINGIEKAVEYFQAGEEKKGCDLIPPITEGIQWVSEALIATKDSHKQEIKFESMNEKLSEIVYALENQDYILIGDLFHYELLPILESIRDNLSDVLES